MKSRLAKKIMGQMLQHQMQPLVGAISREVVKLLHTEKNPCAQNDGSRMEAARRLIAALDIIEGWEQGSGKPAPTGHRCGCQHVFAVLRRNVLDGLQLLGVERMEETARVDYSMHDPIEVLPAPGGADDDGRIAQVIRSGYRTGDKVLRPMIVSVWKYAETADEPKTTQQEA